MRKAGSAIPVALLVFVACTSGRKDEQEPLPEPPPELPRLEDRTSGSQDASEPPVEASSPRSAQGQDGVEFAQLDQGASTSQQTPRSGPSGSLQDEAERIDLAQQKRRFLVEQHIEKAVELRDRLHLEEAERELGAALDLEPDNLRAKQLLAEVGAMLGRPTAELRTVTQQLAVEHDLRVQQLKAEAADSLRKGKLALARGDYDTAIAELNLSLSHIRWAPYSLDWDGVDTEAAALLEQAEGARGDAARAQREAEQRAAYEQLREREEIERMRQQALVANMIDQAIAAFEKGEYDEAMDAADQALRKSPRNQQALEIRDAAFRAGRDQARIDYIQAKREEFSRWREHLQELEIPWTDVITYPDPDQWRALTERRKTRRGLDLSKRVTESELALRDELSKTTVVLPGIEDEESLSAVIDIVRQFTGLPLVVDPAAENAVLDEGVVFNLNFENRLSVEQALNILTDMAGDQVTWTIRHDAVLVTTTEKARGKPVIYNHDVQDLIMSMTDFTGPRIDRIRLLDELEDDDGGGPFGGILESPRLIEIEDLVTLIQENVAVGTWDEDGVSIDAGEGFILIVHAAEVQQQVKDFLEDLRRFNSALVSIESRFLTVGDNWIQELGVDFRGLDGVELSDVTNGLEDMASRGLDNSGTGNEGEGAAGSPAAGFFYDDGQDGDFRGTTQNFFSKALGSAVSNIGGLTFQLTYLNDANVQMILRAVEKSNQFQLVNSQMLSVHNTQRAYVTVVNQQAYIQDFDVEVAQFQAVADPQINVLMEGVVLDVRPTIHHDRKYLTLEIQPTVAKVVALRDFATSLGGISSTVEFQLPELEVQSVNTSAIIPDGGSILLGGLSNIRNIERRAEVPWLARIPILGFFFKQEGYNDERQSLMILIRAQITDVRESVHERLELND